MTEERGDERRPRDKTQDGDAGIVTRPADAQRFFSSFFFCSPRQNGGSFGDLWTAGVCLEQRETQIHVGYYGLSVLARFWSLRKRGGTLWESARCQRRRSTSTSRPRVLRFIVRLCVTSTCRAAGYLQRVKCWLAGWLAGEWVGPRTRRTYMHTHKSLMDGSDSDSYHTAHDCGRNLLYHQSAQ